MILQHFDYAFQAGRWLGFFLDIFFSISAFVERWKERTRRYFSNYWILPLTDVQIYQGWKLCSKMLRVLFDQVSLQFLLSKENLFQNTFTFSLRCFYRLKKVGNISRERTSELVFQSSITNSRGNQSCPIRWILKNIFAIDAYIHHLYPHHWYLW